jgi:hypothetical protein
MACRFGLKSGRMVRAKVALLDGLFARYLLRFPPQ